MRTRSAQRNNTSQTTNKNLTQYCLKDKKKIKKKSEDEIPNVPQRLQTNLSNG